MAQRGHADDCSACSYASLPIEDRNALDATAFQHRRKEAPAQPFKPGTSMTFWVVTLTISLILLLGQVAEHPWMSLPLILLLVIGMAAAFRSHTYHEDGSASSWCPMCQQDRYRRYVAAFARWRADIDFWFAEQRAVRRELHAQGLLWPCPACGALSCPDAHAVTTTYRSGAGYVSYTNPR